MIGKAKRDAQTINVNDWDQWAYREAVPSVREAEAIYRRETSVLTGRVRCGGGYRVVRKPLEGRE